jgi:argininosuccinate lyase
MKKLWQKNWKFNSFIEAFETKEDLLLDQKLIKADILGSIAHAQMLEKIGILSKTELKKLKEVFLKILELAKKNKFKLKLGDEDVHTKIENFLIENCGKAGKKIHTGRSRNDQVLTAIRIFTKEKLLSIWEELLNLIESLLFFAKKYEFVPMAGYTHMQKAMPSSIGMWAGSFVEGFFDDLTILKSAYQLNNQSPLGSAAGYGVPLPLDREYTAKLLGFKKIQANSLYCQNSRGKIESIVLAALILILFDLNKFATDVLLFTTSEFNFFKVSKEICTGSSIMPQKKNVDVAELLRSKIHLVLGNYLAIVSLSSNLPSGYNRDFQDIKMPLIKSLEITEECIKATNILVNNISPQKKFLKKSLTPEIFLTHKVFQLIKQGIPFREAYHKVSSGKFDFKIEDIERILKESSHIGGTGNLGLEKLSIRLSKEKENLKKEKAIFTSIIKNLLKGRV